MFVCFVSWVSIKKKVSLHWYVYGFEKISQIYSWVFITSMVLKRELLSSIFDTISSISWLMWRGFFSQNLSTRSKLGVEKSLACCEDIVATLSINISVILSQMRRSCMRRCTHFTDWGFWVIISPIVWVGVCHSAISCLFSHSPDKSIIIWENACVIDTISSCVSISDSIIRMFEWWQFSNIWVTVCEVISPDITAFKSLFAWGPNIIWIFVTQDSPRICSGVVLWIHAKLIRSCSRCWSTILVIKALVWEIGARKIFGWSQISPVFIHIELISHQVKIHRVCKSVPCCHWIQNVFIVVVFIIVCE